VVCASPDYLERAGAPLDVGDLADHNCIVLREKYSDYAQWRFGCDGDEFRTRVNGTLSSNDGDIVTAWALEGRGLIMRSSWQVAPLIASGRLVQVLANVPTPSADIYALYVGDRHLPGRVNQLLDFLAHHFPPRLGAS
jgi:DNA-binding transcriptional LysR family regulator